MFIGHFAVGFGAKRFAPTASLAALLAAPLLADLLWPPFLLLGWEHVRIFPGTRFTPFDFYDYPWSHRLLMAAVWATLFMLIYWLLQRDRSGAVVVWFSVVSHWVFDWITHRPDLPLYPWRAWTIRSRLVELRSWDDGDGDYTADHRSLGLCARDEGARQDRPIRLLGVRGPLDGAVCRRSIQCPARERPASCLDGDHRVVCFSPVGLVV
jgi:hypothetical protein